MTGLLRMSTYIGVSHQYKVVGPGEPEITVYEQNLGDGAHPDHRASRSCSMGPEHTFAVVPQDDLELEPDEGEM